jgi:putative transposase
MRAYRRHLPHQVPREGVIFVTWSLKGALPQSVLQRLQCEREKLARQAARKGESPRDRALRHGKLIFARADEFLDGAVQGPLYLQEATAARIVDDAILFGVDGRYNLYAWCVMANHVHILLAPKRELPRITKGIKGFTAREINKLQNAVGRTFWQDESYDHWVRDEEELLRVIQYIELNPVNAGLCAHAEQWHWSSGRYRSDWPTGQAMVKPAKLGTLVQWPTAGWKA